MKHVVTLIWICLGALCHGDEKFASVHVGEIFWKLPSTIAMQEQFQQRRAAIMEGERGEKYREIIREMQSLEVEAKSFHEAGEQKLADEAARKYVIKRQEAEIFQQELEEYGKEQERKINIQLVSAMKSSLQRIVDTAADVAKDRKLAAVFDSGDTNTGVPLVLYSKNSEDLTNEVMDILTKEDELAAGKAVTDEEEKAGTAPENTTESQQ